jgi:hypothetical protein
MVIKFIPLESSEVKRNKLLYDLEDLESIINDRLKGCDFGEDIKQFDVLVNTYNFNGIFSPFFLPLSKKKGYRPKDKYLYVTAEVDYLKMSCIDKEQQFEAIKNIVLEGIESSKKMQGRVKGFDFDKLYSIVSESLTEYVSMSEELACEEI